MKATEPADMFHLLTEWDCPPVIDAVVARHGDSKSATDEFTLAERLMLSYHFDDGYVAVRRTGRGLEVLTKGEHADVSHFANQVAAGSAEAVVVLRPDPFKQLFVTYFMSDPRAAGSAPLPTAG